MTLLSTVFCTEAELARRFGADSLKNWADHDEDHIADDGVIDDAINRATEELQIYLVRYSATQLSASEVVSRWCVDLAGYYLSTNRANSPPEWLEVSYQRIMDRLEKILAGKLTLPGVSLDDSYRPTVSNLRIDQRFINSKQRVTTSNSTDSPTDLSQDRSIEPPTILD